MAIRWNVKRPKLDPSFRTWLWMFDLAIVRTDPTITMLLGTLFSVPGLFARLHSSWCVHRDQKTLYERKASRHYIVVLHRHIMSDLLNYAPFFFLPGELRLALLWSSSCT